MISGKDLILQCAEHSCVVVCSQLPLKTNWGLQHHSVACRIKHPLAGEGAYPTAFLNSVRAETQTLEALLDLYEF